MNKKRIYRYAEKLMQKEGIKQINIRIEDNVVYIEGDAPSYEKYVHVGSTLGRIKGLRGIVNNLSYPGKKNKKKTNGKKEELGNSDIVIIGGGVIGCSIARELSRYDLKVTLLEKAEDVACGTSKANNAMVHTGIGEKMGTLKQRLCIEGHLMYRTITDELQVPYAQSGLYIITTRDTYAKTHLPKFLGTFMAKYVVPWVVLRRAKKLGLPMYKIDRRTLLKEEPEVTNRALAAVFSPTYGVTCPYLFTIALAENACDNGVKILLNTEVVDIGVKNKTVTSVVTTKGIIKTQIVINAAGLYADDVADMANAREYTIHPKKGTTLLFDKFASARVHKSLSTLIFPRKQHYKGGGLLKTISGNLQWGPTIREVPDKEDNSVTAEEIQNIYERYSHLAPCFPKKSVITYFSGLRAATFTEDYFIEASKKIKGFVHVAGIQSPGLAAAPAIARMVIDILKKGGLTFKEKINFNPYRQKNVVMRDLNNDERKEIIAKNPCYGRIICRCEQVSEGEIIDAIKSPIKACNMDAIKRRTRAGMGRCQGSFCLPNVTETLSRETGIPKENIMKNAEGSNLFVGHSKCLLNDYHED